MADKGTVVANYYDRGISESNSGPVEELVLDWTADGSGDVEKTLTDIGEFNRIVADAFLYPGAAPNAPTDGYSVYLKDAEGADYFAGCGVAAGSASTVAPVTVAGGIISHVMNKVLVFIASGCGAGKKGIAKVHFRRQ